MADLTASLLGSDSSGGGGGTISIGDTVTSGTAGSVLYVGAGPVLAQDNTNFKWGTTAGQGLTLGAGTATTSVNPLSVTQTWNNVAVVFEGMKFNATDTASATSASGTSLLTLQRNSASVFYVLKSGAVVAPNGVVIGGAPAEAATGQLTFTSTIAGGNVRMSSSNSDLRFTNSGVTAASTAGSYVFENSWNTSGATTLIRGNVTTDTASPAAAMLLDLQLASTSKLNVLKAGTMNFAGNLLPMADLTSNLGAIATRFSTLYTFNVDTGNSTNTSLHLLGNKSTATDSVVYLENGRSWSATSGTQVHTTMSGTGITQGGTAGYTMLLINPVETGTGSGTKLLIDAQVSSVSKFSVNSGGTIVCGGVTSSGTISTPSAVVAVNGGAPAAGGTAGFGYRFFNLTNFGMFGGSGAPSLAAAKGSIYLRTDGSGTTDRMYVNTDGSTTWTAVTTVA